MSVVGLRLKKELEGTATIGLEETKTKKMIATTRSFDKMYTDYESIKERVATFAISCAEKLRRQGSHCNMIMVFIRTNGFRKDLPQYSRNIVVNTQCPTNSSIELTKYAIQGLKHIYQCGYSYKKAGVIVMGLAPADQKQLNLFKETNPKHKPLMEMVDRLNQVYGNNKIKFASQSPGRQWKMKQEKRSPRYTTNIHEIIKTAR